MRVEALKSFSPVACMKYKPVLESVLIEISYVFGWMVFDVNGISLPKTSRTTIFIIVLSVGAVSWKVPVLLGFGYAFSKYSAGDAGG